VRAANNDGLWNETGTSLAFGVEPFFWQTWWFSAGSIGLLVSAGGIMAWWQLRSRHRREVQQLERARRHEQELAHVSRVSILGELSASMAHELNQPLTAILTNAQAAQRFMAASAPDLAEFREILKDIAHDTTRARDVIRHLRALVRKSEPTFAPVDLAETIREVVGFLHGDIVARNVRVAMQLAPDLPIVHGDRIQIQQVMINLLLNAFDALGSYPVPERLVTVRADLASPEFLRVTVCDGGCGIPPDNLEGIFETFYTTKREGMGMGLSVSRTIIEAHGGRLWAENNAERGATLSFTIPVSKEP
jgi:C4-dicarboxylate-specific signal transduction histidine kinase